jgi:pimeloyl-ACP methyl ester carboxylesterase
VSRGRAHPYDDGAIELPDGRLLGYAQYGDPDGDVILWFHGTPGARLQVPPEIGDEGTARGFRIISVERPGNGQSTPHLYRRIKHSARDIAAFADAMALDRFAIVGLSGGGPYVLACAHELPDRVAAAAVLGGIGPTQGPEKAPGYTGLLALAEHVLLAARGAAAWGFSHVLRSLRPVANQGLWLYMRLGPSSDRPVFERPEMAEMFIADILGGLEVGMKGPIYDLALFSRHWGFALGDITVPVRFWQGDADLIVPVEHGGHQAALVQDGKLFTRPGEGHFAGFTAIGHVLDELDAAWPDRPHRRRAAPPPLAANAD